MEISKIISESLSLAWKHKILWVLALLLGGGMSFKGTPFNGNGMDLSGLEDKTQDVNTINNDQYEFPTNIDYDYESVLGTKDPVDVSESSLVNTQKVKPKVSEDEVSAYISKYMVHIIVITTTFLLFILFSIGFGLLIKSFATGALLNGVDSSIAKKPFNIGNLGSFGRISLRENAKYLVFSTFISTAFLFIVMFLPIILLLSAPDVDTSQFIMGVILIIFSTFAFILFSIILNYVSRFALRYVSVKHLKFLDAFKAGFVVFKENFIKSIVMSFANCFISMVFGIISLILIYILGAVFLGFSSLATDKDVQLLVDIVIGFVSLPFVFALIMGFMALVAYLRTYITFTWSFIFNEATQKEVENGQN